jgi:uncharacterized metal-binding protein YceD (DUF177 family)
MQIDLANLPDEGKQFDGEIPPEIFDIKGTDIISVSPLKYSLHAQRFDTELLVTGPIEATFELTCMRSLHPFSKTISIPSAAISIEIGPDGDSPGNCEIDPKYLAVDKPADDGVDNAPPQEKPNPWAALDALDSQD